MTTTPTDNNSLTPAQVRALARMEREDHWQRLMEEADLMASMTLDDAGVTREEAERLAMEVFNS